jgi:spore coat protein U-like protein
VAYSISLSSGSGTFAARSMTSGAYILSYNLYTTAARNVVWGNGAGAAATVGGTGSGSTMNIAVYGRLPAGQNVHPASYADSIVVTVDFWN